MAAASIPSTPGIETNSERNKQDENARNPTVEELLIQIENHLYKSIEHRASLLIAVWSCLAGKTGCFRNMEKVFQMLYRESAMTILSGHWPKVDLLFKRGLSRAMIHFSHSMGPFIKDAEGLCSALVMAAYDPWGDPIIHKLLSKEEIDQCLVDDFIKSEPFELLVIRVECLVNARFEDAAIRLCRCCLRSHVFHKNSDEHDKNFKDVWRWTFLEWLLRLLFRKGRLNDLVAESGAYSCHDGVRLIYRTRSSQLDDSEPLTETLINLFLVRDLLFQSNYCCTSELMSLWCDFQVQKQRSVTEIQDAAHKLLVGHASSSAQFYLFVDILWGKFGASLLPLYIEMYVRGLTSDLNYLEAARQADNKEYIIEIENHMAAMYFKISSMFHSINKEISLECMLSSFSLDPTKERLDWIKKLSLQISKEKALKVAATKNESCKHKLCSKTGCAYLYPANAKKKAVVMCDQAIQVGDESFENENNLLVPLNCSIINDIDESTITTPILNENVEISKHHNFDDTSSITNNENEVSKNENIEQNCLTNSVENDSITDENTADFNPDKPLNLTMMNKHIESNSSKVVLPSDVKEINCNCNEKDCVNDSEVLETEKHCNSESDCKNYVPHNGEISEENRQFEKAEINCTNSKIHDDHEDNLTNCEDKVIECAIPKALKDMDCKLSTLNHDVSENGFITNSESEKSLQSVSPSKNNPKHVEHNGPDIATNSDSQNNVVCVNGCEDVKDLSVSDEIKTKIDLSNDKDCKIEASEKIHDENNHDDCQKSGVTTSESNDVSNHLNEQSCEKVLTNNSEITDNAPAVHSEITDNAPAVHSEITDNASAVYSEITDSASAVHSDITDNVSAVNSEIIAYNECKPETTINGDMIALPPVNENDFHEHDIPPFSHIILDSKIGNLSEDLLSDFVIVLESLRNKQLKSSSKWSQIKHMCEDYLENVSNNRCMILNMQMNESMDSEADSASEITAAGFKGFESHQSDDSVIEDHGVDKSHILRRFMHNDKNAEMATYVNLSDIHCPQIPLEKLFYTEHSSSHLVHKKRHKKHRNHNKNPEKLVLRKLRHSSRAEHDLVKRKKRKKRKGKRTKGHVKKHHFTHGKVDKNCLKNKKKKHKLKKKKEERNSGFISGDYCSDFSSAELMRLVKEHSHSYTKLPAATAKHPHSAGSSSDEPTRKKRKVSFDKKKQKVVKYHDKHKHEKSKSSKRKKKLAAIESCPNNVKNITDHALHGKMEAVNDYSRIVQYSSVKKMEAVQIRQRSVALNLSKVHQEQESSNALVNPCASNAHLQQLVQQNFESSEDIMKMQLLMAQQQPDVMPISTNNKEFLPAANNQAVLKYVCSKMTSHLLSVAQSSNSIPSDSEGSKSSMPSHSRRTYQSQSSKIQPQNLTSNVKHVIIERNGVPYRVSSSSSSLAGTILPVSNLPSSMAPDSRSLMGTVISGGITYPATATSPQMTTFTIPVAHNNSGSKMVTSKVIIPISQCGNIRSGTPTSFTLADSDPRALASTSSSPPISGVIIVKNGNSTQIISGVPQSSSVVPCLPGTSVTLPLNNRNRSSPVITKTVPKMVKQAAKKLSLSSAKKPVIKTISPKPSSPTVPESLGDPVVAVSLLASKGAETRKPDISSTSSSNLSNDNTSNVSSALTQDSMLQGDSETPKQTSSLLIEPTITSRAESIIKKVDKNDSSKQEDLKAVDTQNELLESVAELSKPSSTSPIIKDVLSVVYDIISRVSNVTYSPKIEKPVSSPEGKVEDVNIDKNKNDSAEKVSKSVDEKDTLKNEKMSEELLSAHDKVCEEPSEVSSRVASATRPVQEDEKKNDVLTAQSEPTEISKNEDENAVDNHSVVHMEEDEHLQQNDDGNDIPIKALPTETDDSSPIKTVSLNANNQEKQLQPISDAETSSDKTSLKPSTQGKSEGGSQTSEAPTRSFTSISDAVRFSLMDMDDATDSVENQVVLQAFQTSHASSPASPTYAASESGEERNSPSPSSAVMLSAPQSTSTTELNVSRVSQRFEPSVHCSQSEKFSECQNTVSRTTAWILEDSITEATTSVTVQKSPDIDSCGEGKDDDKPKKKRKKKERVDNDITHKFWCQICSKGFFSAYNLRRHCRNVHKMVLPKGSSDVPFANSSQCLPHAQQADTTTSETSSSRLSYGNVQASCVSPNKGSEYSLLSPSHDGKNQEFSVKSGQHVPQLQQSPEFQMQTPPRMSSQSSSAHISPVTPPKDFRLGTPTSVPAPQISPTKMSPVKSTAQSKFQRLPTSTQVPQQMAKISQMQQIALCGQQALQQRQMGQLQSSGLIQPLPSVACQAQQMQASQCPHFQANKQIVQQRIGQLQLMHHVAQLPTVPHAAHGIQKQAQTQPFKKCSTSQTASKISENEQMQQAAQLAQNQQLLANQQMQKLIQIRQNAIAASGITSQLSLANAIPSVPGSPVKGTTQCFQSQLAAARQAAVVGQIPTAQRAQGTSYNLPSHDASSHQFFSPTVQPSQDQASCPHSSFSAQNTSEFSANTPTYPTIRLSSEAYDGLEDLEQFLLENMPWSGEQSSTHGMAQQSGNRPSSADSLTLSIPSQASTTSQNRGGVVSKGKTSISRPKPRKPVSTSCSKNLLGNLGRGVKKKPCSKKTSKLSDTECPVSKSEVYSQVNLVQQSHELKHCNKDVLGNMPNFSKQSVKNSSVGILNETDSSDSVQCINVTHNAPKTASVGINFNIFSPVGLCTSEKNTDLMCNPPSCKEAYDGQRKNSFLDHSNIAGTSSSNLDQNKSTINVNPCETASPMSMSSAFNPTGKNPGTAMKPFCPSATTSPYGITNETPNPQDIFLGQRNSETSDSNISNLKNETNPSNINTSITMNANNSQNTHSSEMLMDRSQLEKDLFLGGSKENSDVKSDSPAKDDKSEPDVTSKDVNNDNVCESDTNGHNSESGENNPCEIENKSEENNHCEIESKSEEKSSQDDQETNCTDRLPQSEKLDTTDTQSENLYLNGKALDLEKSVVVEDKNEFESDTKSCEEHDENFNIKIIKEDCKENNTNFPNANTLEMTNSILKISEEEKSFIPKVMQPDDSSNHEDTILNDENHSPKKADLENISNEISVNRIALRIRKPQETSNKLIESDKKVQFFVADKDNVKNSIKKSSKKKKVKQQNRKDENLIDDAKVTYKLDTDSKIQKTSLLNNVNKEKDINRSLCMITSCFDGNKKTNSIENEGHEDTFPLEEKQLGDTSVDGIPPARLRLRDTPKTSVKRVCPCCVDSKMPKKCRANGGGNISKIIGTKMIGTKLISSKVSNSLKPKSTLKTRNTTNGQNGKVNTRSSQRLRSRNNAIS